MLEYFGAMKHPVTLLWAVWVVNYENCETNLVLVCVRPEIAVKFGFTK